MRMHSSKPHVAAAALMLAVCLPAAFGWVQADAQGTYTTTNNPGNADGQLPPFALAYHPAQTTIAVLPVIDEQPDPDGKNAAMNQRYKTKAQQELAEQFSSRGFKISDDADVVNYLDANKIDLNDSENQNRRTLYDIGKGVHADLVVFLDIVKTESKWHGGNFFIGSKREGTADLKIWLVDADRQEAIVSDARTEAKSSANDTAIFLGGGLFNQQGGSQFTIRAVGNGVKDLLKSFFDAYSVTATPSGSVATDPANGAAPAPVPAARPSVVGTAPIAAPAPAPSQSVTVFTMTSGTMYYGTISDDDTADGLVKIHNSLGDRILHDKDIKTRAAVVSEADAKALGAVE